MNILYLNHYAGAPSYGMSFRTYYLAREWVRLGHNVRILGADFSHVRASQPGRPSGAPTTWHEAIDGIDYQWFATPAYKGNGVPRVRNIATFLWRVFLAAGRITKVFQPDVVIASSTYPMDIWVARHLAKLANAKLVFELHDLWPLSPIEVGGMSPTHPFIRLCQAAENAAYRDADLVVSMLPKVADHVAQKGLPLDRLVIVPNGIALDDWVDEIPAPVREDIQTAINAAHADGRLVVAYTGSHGLPNALDTLLDAAGLLRNEKLSFILVGDGHERTRLQSRCQDEALSNVQMFAPVPKAQIPSLLKMVDIGYIGWRRETLYRFGIAPNKLMDYMMANLPILHSVEAGNDPVADAGCGLTVAPESPEAVACGLVEIAALGHKKRLEIGARGRPFVTTHHSYQNLARNFINAIELIKPRYQPG